MVSSLQRPIPREFTDAVASLRAAVVRPEVTLDEVPAPKRIAPHAVAIDGDVDVSSLAPRVSTSAGRRATTSLVTASGAAGAGPAVGGDEAGGRLVLLHDPDPPAAWDGDLRVIVLVKAVVEPELAADPLLAEVVWAWLREELDGAGATARELGGTVTRVASETFGALADRPANVQVELRASWTPCDPPARHVEAWAELMCRLAGLPPAQPGVTAIPRS